MDENHVASSLDFAPAPTLWTAGYGAWPVPIRAERLIQALRSEAITRLVDVRLGPCASQLEPGNYGPKAWNLQIPGQGIVPLLGRAGIAYEWIVELGNPQRQDREMAILKAHFADAQGDWPAHRGLARLAARVRDSSEKVAILCACAKASECHRLLIAEELSRRHFGGRLTIRHL